MNQQILYLKISLINVLCKTKRQMKLLILAWRNLWRNRKRTLLTMASVVFAIFFAVVMRSQQLGMYSNAIKNVIELQSGHIQIQGKGFNESQDINDAFAYSDELMSLLNSDKRIKKTIARLNSGGIASTGPMTKEAFTLGIEPDKEGEIFRRNISGGKMIDTNSNGVLLGEKLAHYLKIIEYDVELSYKGKDSVETILISEGEARDVKIGGTYKDSLKITWKKNIPRFIKDSVILMGGGYHGAMAAGIYKVDGIVRLPIPDMNKRAVVMNIKTSQRFTHADGIIASISILLTDDDDLDAVYTDLRSKLDPEKYEVFKWTQLNEELVQQIESDNISGQIFMWILYLIIGFGILGTIIMMNNERKREFAVMIALGMKKAKLNFTVIIESMYIGLLGACGGIIFGASLVGYLYYHPIPLPDDMAEIMESYNFEPVMKFSADIDIFIKQTITVIVLFALASMYTIFKIKHLNVIKTIRG